MIVKSFFKRKFSRSVVAELNDMSPPWTKKFFLKLQHDCGKSRDVSFPYCFANRSVVPVDGGKPEYIIRAVRVENLNHWHEISWEKVKQYYHKNGKEYVPKDQIKKPMTWNDL